LASRVLRTSNGILSKLALNAYIPNGPPHALSECMADRSQDIRDRAKAGSSKRDFVRDVEIALRESRETVYWLRIDLALSLVRRTKCNRCAVRASRSRESSAPSSSAQRSHFEFHFASCILHVAFRITRSSYLQGARAQLTEPYRKHSRQTPRVRACRRWRAAESR
jgi:hypothetical protein